MIADMVYRLTHKEILVALEKGEPIKLYTNDPTSNVA